jgi:hypothetical protein
MSIDRIHLCPSQALPKKIHPICRVCVAGPRLCFSKEGGVRKTPISGSAVSPQVIPIGKEVIPLWKEFPVLNVIRQLLVCGLCRGRRAGEMDKGPTTWEGRHM